MARLSPQYVLLGLLAAEPAHGYQLMERFRDPDHLGSIWHLSTSQLYALLKRLQDTGLIVGESRESADAPPRTEYQITPAGRLALADWLHTARPSASLKRIRTEFLSRLYLAQRLALPVQPIIDHQRTSCTRRLEALKDRYARLPSGVERMAVDLVIAEMDIVITWIDRCALMVAADKATR